MSTDYQSVKSGALKVKGRKTIFKADRPKKSKKKTIDAPVDHDAEAHGGWRNILEDVDLKGGIDVAFEAVSSTSSYLSALDNGRFTLGAPHSTGEPPNPEEVFSVVRTPDENKFALKTGYGKYIGVDSQGQLVATAEAIGTRETFIAVFQDGKSAIQSVANNSFLSLTPNREGDVFVASRTASEDEMINIRTDSVFEGPTDHRTDEDKKSAKECEMAYVKMYQHSKVDLKNRHISVNLKDKKSIRKAQMEGNAHELLLDRRVKTKSDKYC